MGPDHACDDQLVAFVPARAALRADRRVPRMIAPGERARLIFPIAYRNALPGCIAHAVQPEIARLARGLGFHRQRGGGIARFVAFGALADEDYGNAVGT